MKGKQRVKVKLAIFVGLFCLVQWCGIVAASDGKEKVVAIVGGEEITSDYLVGLKSTFPNYITIKEADLIKFAVQRRLVALDAIRLGLDKDPDVKTMLDVRRDEVLNKAYWVKVGVEELKVPPEAVRSYYDAYPEKFSKGPQVRFLWIASADEESLSSLKKRIMDEPEGNRQLLFLKEAKESFRIFPVVAKGLKSPWDSGLVEEEKLPDIVKDYLAKAEEGAIVGPIDYKGVYYLFYIMQKLPPQKADFEQVKEQIKVHLVRRKQEEFLKKRVEELKKRFKVEVLVK